MLGSSGGGGCLSLLAASPPLPCTSPVTAAPPLLLGFAAALSDLALLPLNGFGTGAATELRLQLDHAGADGVTFAARLVALGPVGPVGDHAVDRWGGRKTEGLYYYNPTLLVLDYGNAGRSKRSKFLRL